VVKQASAQTIPNLATVNVDNYSDQQIMQLLQQAQNAGISDAELFQRAQSQGMPADQLQKLRTRIADVRSKQAGNAPATDTVVAGAGGRQPATKTDILDASYVKKDSSASSKPKIFGADIFKNKNNSFEPDLKIATPVNYVLGADDQLDINIYGRSLANWKLIVSPEGNINIPGIGLLNVGGKTIENATAMIKSKLAANNYAVGHGTEVRVSLGNIRSIKVILVGQVEKPGTYTLSSLSTVFNALYSAGGPTDNGSLRQIEVIRDNRVIRRLDVYDFLVKGSQKDNITLRDQDIIRVPTYRTRVEMSGEVKIPALFEVLPGETLQDILNYAGGFTDKAYTGRIVVSQISDQQRRLTDVVEADYKNYIPLRGDKYIVQSILNRYENRVVIKGAVFRPGGYELDKGLTLLQLIQKADGVKPDAFVEQGTITRLKPDNTKELISFNLRDVLNKTVTIPLQREDIVNVSSIFDLRNKYQVTINGSVRKPGTYAYADSMTVEAAIIEAGGFDEGASAKRIEVARRINNADPRSKNSKIANVFTVNVDSRLKLDSVGFVLKPFDIISVFNLPGYEKQNIVKVEGEVLYPGTYTIATKNERISDLLARAGGPTASADIDGASLKRSNTAILGIDKNESDSTTISQEHLEQLNQLKRKAKDSTNREIQPRNDYVGINLPAIMRSPGSKIDLLVEDGDVLRVPKQEQVVRVNGEVLYPSAIIYQSSKSFNAYVLNAGGFSSDALKSGAYIVYPNGTVRGTRHFLFFSSHPKVKPGSEIYVPKRPPPQADNVTPKILAYASTLASIGAIMFEIISLHPKL
jgi:protein involved in polysaccharide export with SLBB domain